MRELRSFQVLTGASLCSAIAPLARCPPVRWLLRQGDLRESTNTRKALCWVALVSTLQFHRNFTEPAAETAEYSGPASRLDKDRAQRQAGLLANARLL